MKVYLSADIEGITGTTHWDETELNKPDYAEFREQMTAEVAAACEGALNAGATEIWVKDAHGSARNLIASKLPRETHLLRGWSGHPYMM
ncbi:MAG: M55 family metallopeptidase, partial [Anaerolineaceae bacterium]|nr:M55 family metallopeptidase [Anaerolineaceae bacterium]